MRQNLFRDLLTQLHARLSVRVDAVELSEEDDFGEETAEELAEVVLVEAGEADCDVGAFDGGECLAGTLQAGVLELAETFAGDVAPLFSEFTREEDARFFDFGDEEVPEGARASHPLLQEGVLVLGTLGR